MGKMTNVNPTQTGQPKRTANHATATDVSSRRSDLPEHDCRRELVVFVESSPGVSLSTASERLDTPRSTVRYHVRVLARNDELSVPTILDRRRLFPPYEVSAVLAALNDEGTRRIVTLLAAREAVTVSELAAALNRSHSTVSYHLNRLDEAGIVERARDTNRVYSRHTDEARKTLRQRPAVFDAAEAYHATTE